MTQLPTREVPHDGPADGEGAEAVTKRVPFGKEMAKLFLFEEGWRNMNHGSFGTFPVPLLTTLHSFQIASERRPDDFIRNILPPLINTTRHALAPLLHVHPSTIVLVPNATTGINVFLRNLVYEPGDTILYFSTTYGACAKTVLSIAETTPATATCIPLLTIPALSIAAILATVTDTIATQRKQGLRPRALLLDTLVSMPGIRLPFEALTQLCRAQGIYSVLDAAHAVGMLPLNLTHLDPDFFVSNAHKWLYVPRACAVMYVPHRNQKLIRTSYPTSHFWEPGTALEEEDADGQVSTFLPVPGEIPGEDDTPFVKLFGYVGTLDNAPYLCVPAALQFRRDVCGGEEAVMAYCADLARKGGDRVAELLGTECLDNEEGTLRTSCSMVCVRLPLDASQVLQSGDANGKGKVSPETVVHAFYSDTVDKYKTFVAVAWWGGAWWARLSAQVYLEMEDFEWVAGVLREICERVRGEGER